MTDKTRIKAIDAHHHFWDPAKGDYSWMTNAHAPINRVFAPKDLKPLLMPAGVEGTILVQTWSSLDETFDFLKIAAETDFVKGVVGWVDMTAANVARDLENLTQSEHGHYLKGIRHQVHDEEDPDWLRRSDVLAALGLIQDHDLVFDLLIRTREIPAALFAIEQNPELRFVVDHIAKPNIANNAYDQWAESFGGFAWFKNQVWCKLSGMVTEADWSAWQPSDFNIYFERVLEVFGPDRVMLGSDWPVCTLAADYQTALDLVRNAIAGMPVQNQAKVLSTNAIDAYKLSDTA